MKHPKLLYVSISSLLLFILLLFSFPKLQSLDITINSSFPHPQILILISGLIDIAFDTIPLLVLSLILSSLLWLRHLKADALQLSLTMAADAILLFIIKQLVARPRPLNSLLQATDFSFPSGHTTTAIVFFGLLTYIFSKKSSLKPIIISLYVLLITLISISRLFLNIHWLSDIIAGLLLGTFILTASIIIRKANR